MVYDEANRQERVAEGEPIKNYYPAVVSERLFQEANLAMTRRGLNGSGRKGAMFSNVFTGLLRCTCGAGYSYFSKGKSPKGGQYLQCSVSRVRGACTAPPMRYQNVEEAILHSLESLDIARVFGSEARGVRLQSKRMQLSLLQDDVVHEDRQILRLVDAIAIGGKTPIELKRKLLELESSRERNRAAIETLEAEIYEELQLEPEKQKAAIADLILKIRTPEGTATNENARRALAGEMHRMLRQIQIVPNQHVAWELMDQFPDWRERYHARTEAALDRLLRERGFGIRLVYQNGDAHDVNLLEDWRMKLKGSRRFEEMRLVSRVTSR